ncbi:MAG: SDR family oxidoreductase [Gammaproteobacteria bacterium]|nr:SDR family oxidoreductase [Gammaproteobacteria bacterium]MYH46513.1 SDR family oxidoreductase [Gammaproteobacteria bacterium]MYL14971.1 SDR family oxidoreductase [Gammaproteobacteria bacterium]
MNILIFGAISAIAQAVAVRYAAAENRFYLVARNGEKLAALQRRLIDSGAGEVETAQADLATLEDHPALIEAAFEWLQSVDLVLIAHGALPDQARCEQDAKAMLEALNVNGLSALSLLTELAPRMREQAHGTLAVITSVAGDRGRPSNYVYGSAKALVSAFLQGLRGKLHGAGVHVIDIRPGLVDSPMTAHLQKSPLFSSPERVAGGIVRAVARKKHTVYVPGYWYFIMEIVRFLPDAIFKRLNF